jgi:hypothetical protein
MNFTRNYGNAYTWLHMHYHNLTFYVKHSHFRISRLSSLHKDWLILRTVNTANFGDLIGNTTLRSTLLYTTSITYFVKNERSPFETTEDVPYTPYLTKKLTRKLTKPIHQFYI